MCPGSRWFGGAKCGHQGPAMSLEVADVRLWRSADVASGCHGHGGAAQVSVRSPHESVLCQPSKPLLSFPCPVQTAKTGCQNKLKTWLCSVCLFLKTISPKKRTLKNTPVACLPCCPVGFPFCPFNHPNLFFVCDWWDEFGPLE